MRTKLLPLLAALLTAAFADTHAADRGDHSQTVAGELPDNLRTENLVAWCIVPFDAAKRGPAARAKMLREIGLKRSAYDWRQQHVAEFEEEILQYRKHGVEFFAFWSAHEKAFELFQKHDLHPQIWRTLPSPKQATQAERVNAAADIMEPLAKRTAELKCKLGLYNHGGWGGEPANLVAVCRELHRRGHGHVGIVYNWHHGHGHIADWPQALATMKPYLHCLNLNGMNDGANPKILALGRGKHEAAMLRAVIASGYDGPVGILDHQNHLDAKESLQANLDGLKRLTRPAPAPRKAAGKRPPNFIVIFCDDLGYGDLGCFGSRKNRTPRINSLARDGRKFTSFYSSSPVCTPSRASLLTGCYPRRVGMHEDFTGHWVLIPRSRRGLHPDELTLAEALKSRGYATACIGKWHLGDQPEHLPTRHGFDHYYGIPYSNDMDRAERGDPPLPLVRAETVIEAPADQATLTRRYTAETVRFIEEHRDEPFFIYLPHTFPHLPLFASEKFHGQSANGRYGDSVEEIDWSTGQILDCLDRLELADDTLVIFTSDNGSNARNGGSNAPLAGKKGGTMEGGMRVPMLARWPGRIPAGTVCDELSTTMDFLPTFCALSGAPGPTRAIDGHDIRDLLTGKPGARTPYEALYYYRRRQLQAVRVGDWKYHLPLRETHPRWTSPEPTAKGRPARLVHLGRDLKESRDVAAKFPAVVKRLQAAADAAVKRLGNDAQRGSEQRPARTLPASQPLLLAR